MVQTVHSTNVVVKWILTLVSLHLYSVHVYCHIVRKPITVMKLVYCSSGVMLLE